VGTSGSHAVRQACEVKAVLYRHLESNDVSAPISDVADSLKKELEAIIYETVLYLRTTEDEAGWIHALNDTAIKIFRRLVPNWEQHETYESLWQALHNAVNRTLSCVLRVYYMSGRDQHWFWGECVLWFLGWRIDVARRLDGEAEKILTEWCKRQVEISPTAPSTPPATRTRAPQTPTRSRIEAFLNRVDEETKVKVNKKDFWLRPTKLDGTSRYSSNKEFRLFQKEDQSQPYGTKKHFLDVLKMRSEVFIEGLEDRRRAYEARRSAKSQR
jgi:hypothetical protein